MSFIQFLFYIFRIKQINKENAQEQQIEFINAKYEINLLENMKNKEGFEWFYKGDEEFLTSLIRLYKPKKILELGVHFGASSSIILNAIQGIDGSKLYSCDIARNDFKYGKYKIGFLVEKNYPQFLSKWKLYTGKTVSAFIEEIGSGIDFLFIDTAHTSPGEALNIIEILPFLKENAIIALHDLLWHKYNRKGFFVPIVNIVYNTLRGTKLIPMQKLENCVMGAVRLHKNQKTHYYSYFFMLFDNWSYWPKDKEMESIKYIVNKYYDKLLINMFNSALEQNNRYIIENKLMNEDVVTYQTWGEKFEDRKK